MTACVGVAAATTTASVPVASVWLGQTGLRVSRLGLGLAALGRPVYMSVGRETDLGPDRSVAAMRRRCQSMLDAAHAAGVRYIDAARSYGLAEQFLNSWWNARALPDRALTVGSKWGYTYTGRWDLDGPVHEIKHLSVETLRRQAYQSGVILGSRLSLYQIHSATLDSGVLEDGAVLTELVRLRESGLCIGLTVTGPRQADTVRRALEVRVDGVRPFQTVQATWNVLEPSAGAALAEASSEGWGVIVKEVLANGRLTDRYGGGRLRHLRAHAAAVGASVETVAVAAALSQPWADIVLSGAVTPDHLRAHVAALDVVVDVDHFASMAEPASEYWRRRELLRWT
jgi:aryl-alcohol dehydrogenase-like predicted oxidoreductase